MKLLIVAATFGEIMPLAHFLNEQLPPDKRSERFQDRHYGQREHFEFSSAAVDMLVTGPGMMHTTFHMESVLPSGNYQLCINAGIAGAIDVTEQLGTVVHITQEELADMGAENGDQFLNAFELRLFDPNEPPFQDEKLINPNAPSIAAIEDLPVRHGITVNKVHGKQETIAALQKRFQKSVESMEGAAFFFTSLMNNVPFYELRALSNYVEPRNKQNWTLRKSIQQLNNTLIQVVSELLAFNEMKQKFNFHK